MTMSQPNIKLSLSRQINFQKQINNKNDFIDYFSFVQTTKSIYM